MILFLIILIIIELKRMAAEFKTPNQSKQSDEAKEKYMKFFMIDYLEFNLRRVLIENTSFCAQRCRLFDNLSDNQE